MNIEDVQSVITAAIGGETVGETVEGLQRFPISVRYPRELRDSLTGLRQLPIVTPQGADITLGTVAKLRIAAGPPMLRSENGRLSGWVYVDLRGRDLQSAVEEMRERVAREIALPPGYSISWSGQFEYLERAQARLRLVIPVTLLVTFVLLYLTFRRIDEALLVMASLPFALIGGFWLVEILGHNFSIATAVGFIALAGVAAEFGVVMLLYLKQAWEDRLASGQQPTVELLDDAIREGALLRIRPKAMTVTVIVAGLLPIMWSHGAGSEVMQRIAAPMIGGMLTAPLLSLFVIPAAFRLLRRRGLPEAPADRPAGSVAPDASV
jgi:Cu(I)/Ag(I) efflux system membrane protein CusA/SilA